MPQLEPLVDLSHARWANTCSNEIDKPLYVMESLSISLPYSHPPASCTCTTKLCRRQAAGFRRWWVARLFGSRLAQWRTSFWSLSYLRQIMRWIRGIESGEFRSIIWWLSKSAATDPAPLSTTVYAVWGFESRGGLVLSKVRIILMGIDFSVKIDWIPLNNAHCFSLTFSRCKEHREATKQMSLWRLPEILTIQLKRFSFRNLLWRDKIDQKVHFPIE